MTVPVPPDSGAARYPGALPFTDTPFDRLRFFGREAESDALLQQLLAVQLLVVFGQSSTGKTSLLNARIFERLRERDLLPIPVLFNQIDPALPALQVFANAIAEACKTQNVEYTPGTGTSLWEFLKTAVFWRDERLQTPVLVLDDFEGLFSHPTEKFPQDVAVGLGQLIGNRLPAHLSAKLQAGEILGFSEQPPDAKILICLSEDGLGLLQELTPEIPSILQNRLRLTGLSADDARNAIVEPAKLICEDFQFLTKPFAYDAAVVTEIVETARTADGTVDPFLLQLTCVDIEKQVRKKRPPIAGIVIVDRSYLHVKKGTEGLAASYYLDAIKRVPRGRRRRRARRLCEEGLLFRDGRRRRASGEDLRRQFKVSESVLSKLESVRLLLRESRNDTIYYEISHPRLAAGVHKSRRWRMPRKVKWTSFGLFALFAIVFTLAVLYQLQQEKARSSAEKVMEFVIFDLRDALSERREIALLGDVMGNVVSYYEEMGKIGETSETLRRQAAAYTNQGNIFVERGDLEAALDAFQKSLSIFRKAVAKGSVQARQDIPITQARIADVKSKQGDKEAALKDLQALPSSTVQQFVSWEESIGDLQLQLGNSEAALKSYDRALEKLDASPQEEDANETRWSVFNVSMSKGDVERIQGHYPASRASLQKSKEILEDLNKESPQSDWQWNRAVLLNGLGDLARDEGDFAKADKLYREMKEFFERQSAGHADDVSAKRNLAPCYDRIGQVQRQQGDLNGALQSFEKETSLMEQLGETDPTNADWQNDLGSEYNAVGAVQCEQGNFQGAKQTHDKSLQIFKNLCEQHPCNASWLSELARGWQGVGEAQKGMREWKDALHSFQDALKIRKELKERDPANAEWQGDLAESYWKMGTVHEQQGGKQDAIAHYQQALAILRPLAEQDRLTYQRKPWIAEIEKLLKALESAAPQGRE